MVEVAKPPGSLFEVGLLEKDCVAVTVVANLALAFFLSNEVLSPPTHQPVPILPVEMIKDRAVPRQQAVFQERGAGVGVFERRAETVVIGSRGMADLKTGVPQGLQRQFDDLGFDMGQRRFVKEQKIDIRLRVQVRATVSPNGDE